MTARRPGPDKVAQILTTPSLGPDGEPIELTIRLDSALELIGQRLRHTLWSMHVDAHEEVTQRCLAHLYGTLRPYSSSHPPTDPEGG